MIWWVEPGEDGVVRRWTSSPMPAPWVQVEADEVPATARLQDGALVALPPRPGPWAVFDAVTGQWTDPRPEPERIADLVAQVTAALEAHVDAVARQRQYTGAVSAASYVASTNPAWAAEAQAFVAWRDAFWAWALEQQAGFEAGASIPTDLGAFIAAAPAITWPGDA